MTENAKTGIFVGTAAALGLIAWLSMPKQIANIDDDTQQLVGKPVFENFTDPTVASALKIVKFDDDLGQLKPFEIARDKDSGAWVIPSHDSYPADAASQVSNVANSFIGLKILTVESTKVDDQKLFGVVEPDVAKLQVGDTGVGTLVEMKDDKGETLVDLIVGKTVRDDEKKRYVRRARTDAIYTAEFDVKPITTDFASWIEGDLLKLSSNDVSALTIRDYNILPNAAGPGQLVKNFDAELKFSPRDATWSAEAIRVYGNGQPTERKLADDEELNTVKINEIKNTLDNLKIVDVARKPKGLASDLKADKELLDDNTKIMSLFKKGFVPGQRPDGGMELYSTNGELAVKLNNGVEYLLRFGKSTAGDASDEDAEKEAATGVALNRTLFVTAKLDESHFPMPVLQKVPETIEDLKELEAKEAPPAEPATTETSPAVPAAADEATKESKPTDTEAEKANPSDAAPQAEVETKIDAPKTEPASTVPDTPAAPEGSSGSDGPKADAVPSESPAPAKVDQSGLDSTPLGSRLVRFQADEDTKVSQSDNPAAPVTDEKKSKPADKKGKKKSGKAAEKKDSDAEKKSPADTKDSPAANDSPSIADSDKPKVDEDKKPAPATGDQKSAAASGDPASTKSDEKKPAVETVEELKERLEAARERITKENTRAIDERNDKLEEAKKKAGELNARFAEWYYEISDSEFKRLRASLDDLIKKKGSAATDAPPQGANPGFPGGAPFQFPGSN